MDFNFKIGLKLHSTNIALIPVAIKLKMRALQNLFRKSRKYNYTNDKPTIK